MAVYGYYTWGDMDLFIGKKGYSPPLPSSNGVVELTLLPDGSTNPMSVIQKGGRGRKQVRISNAYATESDFQSLASDFMAVTERTFTDPNSNSMNAIIEQLTGTKDGEYYEYSMTLKEA